MASSNSLNKSISTITKLNLKTIQGKIFVGVMTMALFSFCISLISYNMIRKVIHQQEELTTAQENNVPLTKASVLELEIKSIESLSLYSTIGFGILSVLAGFIISNKVSDFTLKNLEKVEEKIKDLSEGNIPEKVNSEENELAGITEGINSLIQNLHQVKSFAEEVGNGHFDSEIVVFNNAGVLGKSLAQMRKSLKDVSDEDKIRNWTSEGIAKFAHLLRQNNDNLEELCNVVLSELIKYLKATQGALFIVNKEGKETVLEMKACYAYERRKFQNKTIQIGEGLAGQAYLEKETIFLTEIPQNYLTITSGLGHALPRSILIVPLKLNENVMGILEIASLHVFQPKDISLVEKIAESIASTISGVKVAEETNRLLQESLINGEQLKAQEEEMRQNLEELQATQEQMERQAEEMKSMQQTLLLEKSMFSVLMEFLPDRLTYKDTESRVIRVNKAKAARFNLRPEEMVGTTDYDFFPADHAAKARLEEKELLAVGKPILGITEKVTFDNGEVMFNNTSRIPFKNEEGELVGVFIITKDATAQKMSEASILSQEKIIKALVAKLPTFSYKVDRNGLICNINVGNMGNLFPEIVRLDQMPIVKILPNIFFDAQQNTPDEIFTCKGELELNGKVHQFEHYLLQDLVYPNSFWGFAVQL